MRPKKQQQIDIGELLDDLYYINQSNKDEIKRLEDQFRLRVAEADLAENTADSIIEEVLSQLGQLSAKVKLSEKAIRSMGPTRKHKSTVTTKKNEKYSTESDLQFSTDQLVSNKNLLPIEYSGNGISYAWTGSDPEIQFTFPLDRSKEIGMQIWLFALIKPEYSKQLSVLIDGTHIKHRFGLDEGLFVLSCNLPPSTKTSQTEIKIVLPATHSPMELGTSTDNRKLGIAFNEIRFGKPVSGFAHLLKRLRLSK